MAVELLPRTEWTERGPAQPPTPVDTVPSRLYVHHSDGPDDGPASLRSILAFHVDTRGWADIGYHLAYSPSLRRVWHARGFGVFGAHSPGQNDQLSVVVLGDWHDNVPPGYVVDDLADLTRLLVDLGQLADGWEVLGHRDNTPTACPGRHLYALLPAVRQLAARPADLPDEPEDDDMFCELGDEGPKVRTLQYLIREAGVPVDVDGDYGPSTAQALAQAIGVGLDRIDSYGPFQIAKLHRAIADRRVAMAANSSS